MKKATYYLLFISMVLYFSNSLEAQLKNSFLRFVPENAFVVGQIKSIQNTYKTFVIDRNHFFGTDISNETKSIKRQFGFNPFDIKLLKNNGIDINKKAGISISDIAINELTGRTGLIITFYIPSNKVKKSLSFINAKIKTTVLKNAKYSFKNKTHIYHTPERSISLTTKDSYILFSFSVNTHDTIANWTFDKSILDSKQFNKTLQNIDYNQEIIGYFDLLQLMKHVKETEKKHHGIANNTFAQYEDYVSAAFSLDLEGTDFNMDFATIYKPGSESLQLQVKRTNVGSLANIQKKAGVFMVTGLNYPLFYKMMNRFSSGEMNSFLNEVNKELNINVEKDVINTLAPDISAGVFDAVTLSAYNLNTVLLLKTKNPKHMKQVINKILDKMTQENAKKISLTNKKIAGVDTSILNIMPFQLHIGIYKKTIIISTSRSLYEQVITGDDQKGFLTQLEPEVAAKINQGHHLFYLNIVELQKALNNFAPMINRGNPGQLETILSVLKPFLYMSIDSKINDNIVKANFYIKSYFKKPFITSVIHMVHEQIEKQKKMQEKRRRK